MITTTRTSESTAPTGGLLLAFELGQRCWKLGFTVGIGQRPRIRQMPAGAVSALVAEIARAKQRFGLAAEAPVTSCYEAGRDGFWLHRYLAAHGITKSSIPRASKLIDGRDAPRRTGSIWQAS
jgi:transposase